MTQKDAYHLHPELRGKIRPAAESFFRDLDLAAIDAHGARAGFPADWRTPCAEREADRRKWLDGRRDRDLWIFAYGSLMWDPSVAFDEIRHARCAGHQRSFCLWDDGGRGSREAPGLMPAIDLGGSCEGLAFRIPREKLEHETFVLFRREMLAPVYRPLWLTLDTVAGPVEALGFVANREHESIKPGIPLRDQARMIAQAQGLFGSNFDYLSDLHDHLEVLGIKDPYVSGLFAAAQALRSEAG
ncbi:gamma-glutamylcyclotransferase [Maliponia aquimaris]|uniref:glutathione-specific gamma-glutamylcyclotransferase n=1 Tax=Maliponia aquimaris TaxID=1673631 RepID=A0A238KEB4_9RHOB|nr:gamma-glutamylcyclotransferase [Maliponia aquimaris]SMX40492.1 ChaC-like protein [Maliponia aquimaris]